MAPRTLDDERAGGPATRPHGEAWHYAGVGLLVLVVLAAVLGLLGPREGSTASAEAGYSLTLTYPQITRAGQPAPLHLRIEHADGFSGPVRVAISDELFDHLDFQSWFPSPSAEVGEAGVVVYEFDPPTGDVLEISLDARTAPGQLGGVDRYHVALLVDDESTARTPFTVWRMP